MRSTDDLMMEQLEQRRRSLVARRRELQEKIAGLEARHAEKQAASIRPNPGEEPR